MIESSYELLAGLPWTAIGFWASFVTGLILLFISILGLMAFAHRVNKRSNKAVRVLSTAILLAMAASAANTAYWQISGQLVIATDWLSLLGVRFVGSYLDVIFKGSLAVSVYLHLKALKLGLRPEEQDEWTVLGMAFYPDATGFFGRIFNLSWRK